MKRLLLIILVIGLFSSCRTAKFYERHYNEFASIYLKDSTTTVNTTTRDTTITEVDTFRYKLPNDSVSFRLNIDSFIEKIPVLANKKTDPAPEKESTKYSPQKFVKTEGILTGKVEINEKGDISFDVWLNDSTILLTQKDSSTIKNAIRETTIDTRRDFTQPAEKYIPGFYKFTFWGFWLFVVFNLLRMGKPFLNLAGTLFKSLLSRWNTLF